MIFAKQKKNFYILGLNDFSLNFVKNIGEKANITLIHNQENRDLENWLEVEAILERYEGDLFHFFKNKNTNEIDCLFALSKEDKYNLFTSFIAQQTGIKQTIVSLYTTNLTSYSSKGIVFNIFNRLAIEIKNKLLQKKKNRWYPVSDSSNLFISQKLINKNDQFCGKSLSEINESLQFIALLRKGVIHFYDPSIKIKAGDKILFWVQGKKNILINILQNFSQKKAIIIGGGTLAEYLAKYFQDFFQDIIIIDSSENNCKRIASRLNSPLILKGEGTDMELLQREGVNENSIFISASDNNAHNILSSLIAKNLKCANIFTILDELKNYTLAKELNLPEKILFIPEITTNYLTNYTSLNFPVEQSFLNNKLFYIPWLIENNKQLSLDKIYQFKRIYLAGIIRNNKFLITNDLKDIKKGDILQLFFEESVSNKLRKIILND